MFAYLDKIRRSKWQCLLLLLLTVNTAAVFAEADKLRVGFLCSAPADHPFWGQVVQVMQAVANDLDIDLVVKYDSTRSTYTTKRLGIHLLNSEPRQDYFLTKYWPSVTNTHMELARERGTRVFIFNSDIASTDYETVGRTPRAKFENWIGHMVPDDRAAAFELASMLIDKARHADNRNSNEVRVLGLDAPGETSVAVSRRQGLKAKIDATPGAILEELVVTNWEADSAREVIAELLKKHPDTDVVWAANEAIAWGAVQAVERSGKTPGKDVLIGGFDWNPQSIEAIADGRITASMFGHFMEGAWALILVHDYHYGFDFADGIGMRISTPLNVIDAGSYQQYKVLLDTNWEKIDFRKLSKKYNPQLQTYNFNINQFIN
jgi:ABC-type sugar transport system substrate-binding protein